MRFTFPQSDRSNVIVNLPRHGGTVEVVGDRVVRGISKDRDSTDGAYFVAEFSKPFAALGTFRKSPGDNIGWGIGTRSEEHTSELQSLMRISYAVFCLNKKKYERIEQHKKLICSQLQKQ